MRIVVDASAALQGISSGGGLAGLGGHAAVAPPLMWSEAISVLHEARWRGQVSRELAERALERLCGDLIERVSSPELHREAWRVAEELGWAKTYDAEYVALARMLGSPLLTVDARLGRRARDVVAVIGPADL